MRIIKLLFSVIFIALLLSSCAWQDPLYLEGRITEVELLEGSDFRINIEGRDFLFTKDTYFVDSWRFLSGKTNAKIDDRIVGRYCLAGWGQDGETLKLLDISGWQQPVF